MKKVSILLTILIMTMGSYSQQLPNTSLGNLKKTKKTDNGLILETSFARHRLQFTHHP